MRVRRLLVPVLVFLACAGGVPTAAAGEARLARAEQRRLLRQAEQAFRQALKLTATQPARARFLYARSAALMERIAREGGVHNGRLYYNLGNAWFLQGDLGRAILYYLRARRYLPGDDNLEQNLAFARSRREDRLPESQERRVLRTLLFWHYDIALRTRVWLLAAAWILFWGGLVARLSRRGGPPAWACALPGLIALAAAASVLVSHWQATHESAGVILAGRVVARKGDGLTYSPSFKQPLHAGTEFELRERRGGWYRVRLSDGRECWLPAAAVGLVAGG